MIAMIAPAGPGKKQLPPYVSYRTFWNFLEGMNHNIPARIDRSYWGDRFSGSSGTQLMAALRFLDLTDGNGYPTIKMRGIIGTRGTDRSMMVKQIVQSAYGFIFDGHLDPQTATYAQLEEAFHVHYQLASDVARKCIKFFIGIAGEGSIPLSSFITSKTRASRPVSVSKKSPRKGNARKNQNNAPAVMELTNDGINLDKLLLEKFPSFDPGWTDEIKLKWFTAFDELVKRTAASR